MIHEPASAPAISGLSLQDSFLERLRREQVPVFVYLMNGIKLQGQIVSYDQYALSLQNSVNELVYKHAISTVVAAEGASSSAGGAGRYTSAHPERGRSGRA